MSKGHTHVNRKDQLREGRDRELHMKDGDDNLRYAYTEKSVGGGRFMVVDVETNVKYNAALANRFKKGPQKQKLNIGNLVLLQRDESSSNKDVFYIIHIYSEANAKKLKQLGELQSIVNTDSNKETIIFGENDVTNNNIDEDINIDDI
jgi:hypothetical protein